MKKAGDKSKGSVLASDAFFPFPDNVEAAAAAGVTAIIQPGGSVKDADSIAACDAHGIAMLFTGPWDLSGFPDVNYGIQILPGDQNHQTISGPDQWVMLDNGDDRRKAAWTFLKWFTGTEQAMQWSIATGDLPIRASQTQAVDYSKYTSKYKGVATFVDNEQNAVKARPVLASYNEISQAMGQAIQGRSRQSLVVQHLRPLLEGEIRRHNETHSLIGTTHDVE